MAKHFGVIGCGNMGGAILSGALSSGVLNRDDVYVCDILSQQLEYAKTLGVHTVPNDEELAKNSDLILLAVKPQDAAEALSQCGRYLDDKAVVSIVAGLSVKRIRTLIDGSSRILRLLPNTPALVHEGAFALSSDNDLHEDESDFSRRLFTSLGLVEFVPEHLLDAVCGLSGGGPAYVAMFIEALADGGVREGLPRATAYKLAAQTCLGTAKLMLEKNLHPAQLKDMVTSPGGTTIEGSEVLERGSFRGILIDAVHAGAEKSKSL